MLSVSIILRDYDFRIKEISPLLTNNNTSRYNKQATTVKAGVILNLITYNSNRRVIFNVITSCVISILHVFLRIIQICP